MVARVAVAVGRFVYGYIFGDDWVVAVVMILALVATGLLLGAHINAWWLVPVLAIAMTGVSLWRRRATIARTA
ncbi:MAG TPA: hypothetical protein VGT01_01960 [Candidatus Dormibacteraeota bacterium]|nr:hypothetical protein [Candidatus Dormibacteraeota bacterium]HEV2475291.1 hypothetical protein [Candidatus Dormibacteraeota bacterium]